VNSVETRAGRLLFLGDVGLLGEALPELERAAQERRKARGFQELGATRVFFKHSALVGKQRLRHALRRTFGLSEIPRLAEFENLTWLRERGFCAPRPVLAGAFFRGLLPAFQFLFTEAIEDAPTLQALLEHGRREERRPALLALARELARLHALGFVHRDLFPRNLLVRSAGARTHAEIVFLDAWRGGPGPGLRGPDHDLGCFFLEGATLLEPAEQSLFLTTYREEGNRLGRSQTPEGLRKRAARARRSVHAREGRRRPEVFAQRWDPPPLG